MNNSDLLILTFIITAIWDILLRSLSLNTEYIPTIINRFFPFIGYLTPYFKQHTLLAAALLAGFIGATTQFIIINIIPFPTNFTDIIYIFKFLFISFIISALYGFLMKWSNLFPHLENTYYKNLGLIRSLYHDGISGLIVQITIIYILIFII